MSNLTHLLSTQAINMRMIFTLWIFCFGIFESAHALIKPPPPSVKAKSFVLMDATTGNIILEENSDQQLAPASLTKIMTSYVTSYELAQGNISEEDAVPISIKAWRKQGSKMFVREGTKVLLEDLLKGIIIQSGNDASIAVAEHIAGTEEAFADLMNQHAKMLGMNNTNFTNSTGWPDPKQLTTARDLAILTQALINNYPDHYKLYSQESFTYNDIPQPNRNTLLGQDNIDGVKTGYTKEAGYCLVASSEKEGTRLISVVMGTSGPRSRAAQSKKILSYGHRFYQTVPIYNAQEPLTQSQVWKGESEQVSLGVNQKIVLTLPKSNSDKLEPVYELPEVLNAPLIKGQEIGKLKLMLENEVQIEAPLIALNSIEQAGFFKRIWHSIVLFFSTLF